MNLEELKKQADQYPLSDPTPVKLPELTFWPFILAWGVLFFFWGLITSLIITAVGILIIIISISGWVQDLNHELE
jgi:hypothetical protein